MGVFELLHADQLNQRVRDVWRPVSDVAWIRKNAFISDMQIVSICKDTHIGDV